MKIVLANSNSAHASVEEYMRTKYDAVIINRKEDLNFETLSAIGPDYIFFPHWSYIIPPEIFNSFKCVLFHMTDLPYGRGGSPLQNLIIRGKKETKLSVICVEEGFDTGDIYLKEPLSLEGSAAEIFKRSGQLMKPMIDRIITSDISPAPQTGEATVFKRRKPEQSNLNELSKMEEIYDHIRMLDSDGYPHAFLETEHFKFEFTNASKGEDSIDATVRIVLK